jgi:hypothetical protein
MALDFPTGPTVGQLFPATATPGVPQWAWDGSAWTTPVGLTNQMTGCKIQRFTATGTYTPTPGMQYCIIEAVGGGGGGGGASCTVATSGFAGGGGGSGSYSKRICTSVQIGASQPVTIGTGGAGGVAANPGGNGTATSVGGLVVANGGIGGLIGNAATIPGGGPGGAAGTGDIAIAGNPGQGSGYNSANSANIFSSSGGSSMLGPGAVGLGCGGGNSATGQSAQANSGGGGGGAAVNGIVAGAIGGVGGTGLVIITEYGTFTSPTAVVRGHLHGLTLSAAGGTGTFTVALGQACDSTFTDLMTIATAMTKNTGGFAVGSGNGSLDTGTIAASTWYHVHVIKNQATGAVDVLVSLSATNPTLPSGFSLFRRIGSMRSDASNFWRAFSQLGDEFLWAASVNDANNSTLTTGTRTLVTLTVPPGVQVRAMLRSIILGTAATTFAGMTSPDETDQPVSGSGLGIEMSNEIAGQYAAGRQIIRTDTSSRIAIRSQAAGSFYISTFGWIDRRGRDA